MDVVTVIVNLLSLVAGAGVFLIGCSYLSSNLESLGGNKLKGMFKKTSKSKLLGVGVGTLATAVIQSSSATTVMVIGFVNAGLMPLSQAATIIFGANIGTTITGQLVALGLTGGSAISPSLIFSALAGIGAMLLSFAKRDGVRKVGGALAGLGMIFIGLSLMSSSMKGFAQLEEVKNFLATFNNPLLLVVVGACLTAVVQSSSAITSLAITMVVTSLISLNQGIYITMGSNIGTCVTALIAALASGTNAKRASLIHLIFNVGGVVVFMVVGLCLSFFGLNFGIVFDRYLHFEPQLQLAFFHTAFNLITVILILPFTRLLVKLVTKILPDKQTKQKQNVCKFIDERMLATPPIAVAQIKNEIVAMAEISVQNFVIAMDAARSLDFSQHEQFVANEKHINSLYGDIAAFAVKLFPKQLSAKDRLYVSSVFRSVIDLERVGDYAENIMECAQKLKDEGLALPTDAAEEVERLKGCCFRLYIAALTAYKNGDEEAYLTALKEENRVDELTAKMSENNIARLSSGNLSPIAGAQFLSLLISAERIADHFINLINVGGR
jgi:phosphate:Na+ symporter